MRPLTVIGLGVGMVGTASAAPLCWELNANLTIDMVNVATNASVLYNTTTFPSNSLARTPTGNLISATAGGNLWDVTGPPIPVGVTGKSQIADLDYGVGGLWGYSSASQELFFFNLGSLAVTYSQVIALPPAATVTGVAYQPGTGDIFLSAYTSLNNDYLLKVANSATSANLVGAMANSDPLSYFSDIDFDASGTLYAMSFYHRYFFSVSTTNAATSFISAGPHKDTTAMALDPVPEPASLVMLATGCCALIRRRRH